MVDVLAMLDQLSDVGRQLVAGSLTFHPTTNRPIVPPAVLAAGLRLGRPQDVGPQLARALAYLEQRTEPPLSPPLNPPAV